MAFETLLTELKDQIFTITINRPDKLNALNRQVMEELSLAIDEIYNNPGIRSAILTGAGEKAFVAGADISEFIQLSPADATKLAGRGQDIFFRIEESPKPIIAAVNGFALGGGCELALACHFRLGSTQAKFGQPEVNLGLIPGYGGTQRLTALAGRGRALELMMSSAMVNADQALAMGLLNHITAPEELLPKCREILGLIGTKAPLAISKIIACVQAAGAPDHLGYQVEREAFWYCFSTEDGKEGCTAFLEKRKPVFRGK